ncbi:unnamed protein product [Heterosigma akashiwo]
MKTSCFVAFFLAVIVSVNAFTVPTSTNAFSRSVITKRASKNRLSMEMDTNTLIGVAAGLGGLVGGIALVAFTEQQGVRSEERGAISESLRSDLSGKLLEDFEVQGTEVDDVVTRMQKALAEVKGVDESKVVAELTEEEKKKKAEEADDGW